MTEILLFVLSLSILAYHAWYVIEHDKQIKMLTRAVLSKDIHEFTNSEIKQKKVGKKEPPKDELVELKDLSDDQFGKLITKQLKENG